MQRCVRHRLLIRFRFRPPSFPARTHTGQPGGQEKERETKPAGDTIWVRHPCTGSCQADGVATSCAAGQPALSLSGCGRITGRGQRSLPPSQAQLRLWCGCRGAGRPRGKRKPGAGRGERSILPWAGGNARHNVTSQQPLPGAVPRPLLRALPSRGPADRAIRTRPQGTGRLAE